MSAPTGAGVRHHGIDLAARDGKKNIEAIAQVEQQLHNRRSRVEKIGDWIAGFFGSLWFIAAHAAFFALWIALNVHLFSSLPAFDPYPFPFLGFIVGIEFIFLTTFVLMNQSLQSKRQERWGHLTLQVALLTEQEAKKNMQMLQLVCQHLGLEPEEAEEAGGMAPSTPVTALVEEIEKAREVGEALVEEVVKVQEVGEALVEEMEKTREAGIELVGEMQKTVEVGAELVEKIDKMRDEVKDGK